MPGNEARLQFRERGRHGFRVLQALEQPQVPGAVQRDLAARAVALDAEPALLEADGAREPVTAGRVHEQQQLLTLAVAGGVLAVAEIPDVLAERVGALCIAFQRLAEAQRDHDRVEIRELGVLLDACVRHRAAHDVLSAVGQLVEVSRQRQGAPLRRHGTGRGAGGKQHAGQEDAARAVGRHRRPGGFHDYVVRRPARRDHHAGLLPPWQAALQRRLNSAVTGK